MDVSAIIINLLTGVISVVIARFCVKIGLKTGFPRHWKRVTAGFILVLVGQILFVFVNFDGLTFGEIVFSAVKDLALTIILIGFILIAWGKFLFSEVADRSGRGR